MSLTDRELKQLTAQMPPTSSIMASAIAKLLLTSPNPKLSRSDPSTIFASFPHLNSNDWSNTGVVGALLLVIDRGSDAVLLQIFDLDGMMKRFEFEVYYDMEYLSLDPCFHAFEMEECVAGLSFSSRDVARKFLAKMRALTPESSRIAPKSSAPGDSAKKNGGGGFFGGGRTPKTPQISSVLNVTHHQHVGMKDDGTLDMNAVSPEWRMILKQAGVKKRDLKNPEVSRALVQSIQQSGYSLAVAPGVYVKPSPMKPKEGPLAERRAPPQSAGPSGAGMQSSNNAAGNRQTKVYTPQELQKYYTKEQVDAYALYQRQLAEYEKAQAKYLEDLVEYERQMALQKWEKDNQGFLQEQERLKRVSKDPRYTAAPPLPPRKKKLTADPIGGSSSSVMGDNRPRFETAPPGPSATKSMASAPPSITTYSLPNPPGRKPVASPVAASAAVQRPLPAVPQRSTAMALEDEDYMHRPESPQAPPAPSLPVLKNGDNPVLGLQEQLQAVRLKPADRPQSKMMLRAVAGSQLDLRDVVAGAKKNDPSKTEDILGTLINALAVRRAQLGEDDDDDDDDWSD